MSLTGKLFAAAVFLAPIATSAATIQVNDETDVSTNGDGKCTLREALLAFETGDTTGASGCTSAAGVDTIELTKSVTLTSIVAIARAAGCGGLTLQSSPGNTFDINTGGGTNHVVVTCAGPLNLNRLSFKGKASPATSVSGGCLALAGSDSNVTISNATFDGCRTDVDGGAVHVNANTALTMSNTEIKNSHAEVNGGAIYLTANTQACALGSINVHHNSSGDGGAVFLSGRSCQISGGQIHDNDTSGLVVTSSGFATVTGVAISGNVTSSSGGGVYVASGTVFLTGGTNVGPSNAALGTGGGVYVHPNGALVVANAAITNNGTGIVATNTTQTGAGIANQGKVLLFGGTAIIGNHAVAQGGGIYQSGGTGITCVNPSADAACALPVVFPPGAQAPGAVSIANNSADTGGGVAIHAGALHGTAPLTINGNSAQLGAGLFVDVGGPGLSLTGEPTPGGAAVDISNNTASTSLGLGGGLFAGSSTNTPITNQEITFAGNVRFQGNVAKSGGAVYLDQCITCTLTHASTGTLQFVLNQATAGSGGAIFSKSHAFDVRDFTVVDNTASIDGGGLHLSSSANGAFARGAITGNTAGNGGGGIFLSTAVGTTMQAVSISGNHAMLGGAGVYTNGNLALTHMTITGNDTADGASGISNFGILTVSNSIVFGNTSAGAMVESPDCADDNSQAAGTSPNVKSLAAATVCPLLGPAPALDPPAAAQWLAATATIPSTSVNNQVPVHELLFNTKADFTQSNPAVAIGTVCTPGLDARQVALPTAPCDLGALQSDRDFVLTGPATITTAAGTTPAISYAVDKGGTRPVDEPAVYVIAPTGFTLASSAAGWTCAPGTVAGVTVCTQASPLNAAATLDFEYDIAPDLVPAVYNIGAHATGKYADPRPNDNFWQTDVTVTGVAETTTSITSTPAGSLSKGSFVTYHTTVANAGPSTAVAYTFLQTLPAPLIYVSSTCAVSLSGTCTTPIFATNSLTTTMTIPPAGAATITATAYIDLAVNSGTQVTSAVTTTKNGLYTDVITDNADDVTNAYSTATTAASDVAVSVSSTPTAFPGDSVSFSTTLGTNGPGVAQAVSTSTTLGSAAITFDSASLDATCSTTATFPTPGPITVTCACTGTCTLASSTSLVSASGTVNAGVAPNTTIASTATATVGGTIPDNDMSNNQSSAQLTINEYTDVSLAVSPEMDMHTDVPQTGVAQHLVFTATNAGPSASDVVLTLPLPSSSKFVSLAATGGTCTQPTVGNSGTIVCNGSGLAAAGALSVALDVTLTSNATFSGAVTSSVADRDPTNNDASATVTVMLAPPTGTGGMTGTTGATGSSGAPIIEKTGCGCSSDPTESMSEFMALAALVLVLRKRKRR